MPLPPSSSTSKTHSATVTTLAITNDVDGQTRSSTYDIGADEAPTARPGASHQYPAVY